MIEDNLIKQYQLMIQEINEEIESGYFEPTEFESNFLESISKRVRLKKKLSEKQDITLEKMWEKSAGYK